MTPLDSVAVRDRLIAFPTVSRASNLDLIGFVRDLLAGHGIAATLIGSADGRKANLFATVGGSGIGGVVLSGHTDVVPADSQAWTSDPFRIVKRDGRLLRRGAADMKGFLSCAVRAATLAAGRRLRRPLHLAFSYDEELGCRDVRGMLDQLAVSGLRPEFCAVVLALRSSPVIVLALMLTASGRVHLTPSRSPTDGICSGISAALSRISPIATVPPPVAPPACQGHLQASLATTFSPAPTMIPPTPTKAERASAASHACR